MSLHEREKLKLLQRVRRLRGQLDAVERLLNADEDCGGQLMLLAAVRGGVNGLMGEVMETHIRFHLADGAKEQIAQEKNKMIREIKTEVADLVVESTKKILDKVVTKEIDEKIIKESLKE